MAKDLAFKKKFAKEMRIWADLHHEAVLPFLGYFFEGKEMLPSLVSEWMERGTVDVFMKKFPRGGEDTWNMVGYKKNPTQRLRGPQSPLKMLNRDDW